MNSGTPQPSALASLQRYERRAPDGSNKYRYYFLVDEVIAAWAAQDEQPYFDYNTVHGLHPAWPTQAQGEAVAFRKRYSDGTFTAWMDIALWSPGDKVAEYAYTHPSPSTAALREALRDMADLAYDFVEGELAGTKYYEANMARIERARTLLDGDSRG